MPVSARLALRLCFIPIFIGNFLTACSQMRAVAPPPTTSPLPAVGGIPVSTGTGHAGRVSSGFQAGYLAPASEGYVIDRMPEKISQISPAQADTEDSNFIPLETFAGLVADGQSEVIRGVYAAEVFALRVVQQPAGDAAYVSDLEGVATQFGQAAQMGVIGLLAHNYTSGRLFFELSPQNHLSILYGDGRAENYVIKSILRYQALQPEDPYSSFADLDTGETLTASQLFKKVYMGDPHLTLQTCIEQEGAASWGRIFIIAEPIDKAPTTDA
ncbi:MAG: hypothetical protein IT308_08735 [Anaerolineaceae bacterium]|nr:hypothetical protein [Anaerolineaceae bacterium]